MMMFFGPARVAGMAGWLSGRGPLTAGAVDGGARA